MNMELNEAKEILKQMHNEYPDASHICYAYILDDSANNYYYSDDGEPNKTAGFPIYNAVEYLLQQKIKFVLVKGKEKLF